VTDTPEETQLNWKKPVTILVICVLAIFGLMKFGPDVYDTAVGALPFGGGDTPTAQAPAASAQAALTKVQGVSCVGATVTFPSSLRNTAYITTKAPGGERDGAELYSFVLQNVKPANGGNHCVVASGKRAGEPLLADACLTLADGNQKANSACPVRRECKHSASSDSCESAKVALAASQIDAEELNSIPTASISRSLANIDGTLKGVAGRLSSLEKKFAETHPEPERAEDAEESEEGESKEPVIKESSEGTTITNTEDAPEDLGS